MLVPAFNPLPRLVRSGFLPDSLIPTPHGACPPPPQALPRQHPNHPRQKAPPGLPGALAGGRRGGPPQRPSPVPRGGQGEVHFPGAGTWERAGEVRVHRERPALQFRGERVGGDIRNSLVGEGFPRSCVDGEGAGLKTSLGV